MAKEYSINDLKVHYELLQKVNSDLPDVVTAALLEGAIIEVPHQECILRVMGRTLRILNKITEDDYLEMSFENSEKTRDIISSVNENLVLALKFNIMDMLVSKDYSMYTIAIHTMLDTLFFLDYITAEEFEKAYLPGDANDK